MKWKPLLKPKEVIFEEESFKDTYGKLVVQPLERGYGLTLGNALRRVLLSSIQGAAVSAVKIDGVLHEFTTLTGVLEDITEIILNIKGIRLKLIGNEPKKIFLSKSGTGEVLAKNISKDPDIKILNPKHKIATVTDENGKVEIEMLVTTGTGYVPAERSRNDNWPIGTIPVDAFYSPIKKVTFNVENTRVGHRTDYDKLLLELWTDGSIRPDDAAAFAAKLLHEHYALFISFKEEPIMEEEMEIDEEAEKMKELLATSVEELELSVRSQNCLRLAKINALGDLVQKTEAEMLKYRNFGRKSLSELSEKLAVKELKFGMDVAGLYPPEEKPEEEPEVAAML